MQIRRRPQTVHIDGDAIRMRRTTGGVVELWAQDEWAMARGTGFVHAHDRMAQMMLFRLSGEGRLGECFKADEQTLAIDILMRQMRFAAMARAEVDECSPAARQFAEAYAAGVNAYLQRYARPPELILTGYHPEPWTPADTLLIIKLMSYVGLAETQQDLEKFLIQAIQNGTPTERLKLMFAPHLDSLDEEIVDLIRQVTICDPLLPSLDGQWPESRTETAASEALRSPPSTLRSFLPSLLASNNWVVSGKKSSSGDPMQCHDPHVDCHRLPPLWYELITHTAANDRIGASVPGIPGLIMGRSRGVSLGLTYGMMDMIDYFIEDCRGGCCRRDSEDRPLEVHTEVIHRKKKPPVELTVFENDLGVLETDPYAEQLNDGFYLCRAYSAHRTGAADTLHVLATMPEVSTVADAQQLLRRVSFSANWVIAEKAGHIGYQQSGLLPARQHSGLYPVPAWEQNHRWNGLVSRDELASQFDPDSGVIVTANEDRNQPPRPMSINAPAGPYRAKRIRELLSDQKSFAASDMERIQIDLLSVQAREFLEVLRPLIPATPAGQLLAEWDCRYNADSQGATLFETFYWRLLEEVFGDGLFGRPTWQYVASATCLAVIYNHIFDRIVLGEDESWFGPQGGQELFRQLLDEVTATDVDNIPTWGQQQQLVVKNVFFFDSPVPGWLKRLLGIDYGPIALQGNRNTPRQGSLIQSHGQRLAIAPSYRFITDLATMEARTALPGGPSAKSASPFYLSDIARWLTGTYKTLKAGRNGGRESAVSSSR